MSHTLPHIDVAAYAAGHLAPDEQRAFAAHLEGCADCRRELAELEPVAALLADAPGVTAAEPPGLRDRTLQAVARAASAGAEPLRPASRRRWAAPALAAAACLVLGVVIGLGAAGGDGDGDPPVEAVAGLVGEGRSASVSLVKTGIGRVVTLRTGDLPILPKGEFYELWFVGERDRSGRPDRISAGTFHPDEQGRSDVTFAAAVDPTAYRRMAITAEPGDGDPAPAGSDVLTGPIDLR